MAFKVYNTWVVFGRRSDMWGILSVGVFVMCGVSDVASFFDIGTGRWQVLNVLQCEEPEQYEIWSEFSRHKINRTHDCFNAKANIPYDIDFSFGIQIDAYKKVDGGYKFFTQFRDVCICTYLKFYAKENTERALTLSDINPPGCPIPANNYTMRDFIFDYSELNPNGIYGTYETYVYILKKNKTRAGCIKLYVSFEKEMKDD